MVITVPDPCQQINAVVQCEGVPGLAFTSYPCAIDGSNELPFSVDLRTPVKAEVVNRQRNAIIAIESELGIQPSGTFTTVRQRLDAFDVQLCTLATEIANLQPGGAVTIQLNGTSIVNAAETINFTGTGVNVTATSSTVAEVIISGGSTIIQVQETIPVTSNGQTTFSLSNIPDDPTAVEMFINRLKYDAATEYSVSGQTVTYSGSYSIQIGDTVEFWYLAEGTSVQQEQESFTATSNGQTSFTLSQTPADVTAVQMFVNRLKQEYAVDYTIVGTAVTYSGSYTIQIGDTIEFWYIVSTGGGGSGSIAILDEGVPVELNTTTINFIGPDVTATAIGGGVVNVFIPPAPFLSHWNTSDGSNGAQFVTESISRTTARISTPVAGVFNTNGWEGTDQDASIDAAATFTTPANTTGFGGDSTMVVNFFDADGVTILDSLTTTAIVGNAIFTSASGRITVTITGFALDSGIRFSANANVSVAVAGIFSDNSLDGGRYHVEITHNTDTNTDGTGPYLFTQSDVFYDTDVATPSINAGVAIAENVAVVKHLSGLEYYIIGSTFDIDVSDIDDHNRNTSRTPTSLDVDATEYGIPAFSQSPFGVGSGNFTGWNNNFDTQNVDYSNNAATITQVDYRLISPTANANSDVSDPWNTSATIASPDASVLIDTFLDNATDLFEDFNGEDRRETATFPGIGSWVSTNSLVAGEAMVYNSLLISPEVSTFVRTDGPNTVNTNWTTFSPSTGGPNPNYTGLTVPVNYYRRWPDSTALSRSSFTFTFTGSFVVDATTDLTNSDLEIFLYKIGGIGNVGPPPGNTTPLELHGPAYNFATFDDGVTDGHVREGSSSGNTVNGTFGGFNMQDGLFCQIRINNSSIQIDSITVTLL